MEKSINALLIRGLAGFVLGMGLVNGIAHSEPATCQIPAHDIAAVHERQLRALNAGVTKEPQPTERARAIFERLIEANQLSDRGYVLRGYAMAGFNGSAVYPNSIVLSEGAMDTSVADEEIAAVIAHELGHLELAHAVAQACEQAKLAPSPLGFQDSAREFEREAADSPSFAAEFSHLSRKHELEADAQGLQYLARAGFSPVSLPQMLARRVGNQAVSSTHPPMPERMEALLKAIAASAKPIE